MSAEHEHCDHHPHLPDEQVVLSGASVLLLLQNRHVKRHTVHKQPTNQQQVQFCRFIG